MASGYRRDVARSRKEAILAKVKRPGSSARSYVNKAQGVKTPARGAASTADALAQLRAGGAQQGAVGSTFASPVQGVSDRAKASDFVSGYDATLGPLDASSFGGDTSGLATGIGTRPSTSFAGTYPVPQRIVGTGNTPAAGNTGGVPKSQAEMYGEYARGRIDEEYDPYGAYVDQKQAELTEWVEMRDSAIAAGEAEAASQYNDIINDIKADIARARQQKADSIAAFERYRSTVDPHLQGAVDAAEATDLSGLEQQVADAEGVVAAEFNSGVAEVDELLARIAPDNADLAAAVEGTVNEFRGEAEAALREDMSNVHSVAAAAKEFAEKTAAAIQQQDITITDVEKQKTVLAIEKAIADMQDQLADAEAAKANAMAEARNAIYEQYGDFNYPGSEGEMWQYAFNSWAKNKGLSEEDAGTINDIVQMLHAEGYTDRASAEAYMRDYIGQSNMLAVQDLIEQAGAIRLSEDVILAIEAFAYGNGATVAGSALDSVGGEFGQALRDTVAQFDQWDNEYRAAMDAFDMWRSHKESYANSEIYGREYGNAVADGYGYQGGTTEHRGAYFEGEELRNLFYEAALYVFDGDAARAGLWTNGDELLRLVQLESGGYVGRLNTSGASELGIDSYDTASALRYLQGAQNNQFSSVGWPPGRDGKRHSASGLGQLNASNYKRFASEFGGVEGVGNPFVEAVAMLRYIQASHGNPARALSYRLDPTKRGY